MSEPEFERFLDDVSKRMGLSCSRRKELREELRAHLDEQWDDLPANDQDRQSRIEAVLSDFGPPDRLARALALPYRRRLVRVTAAVAASLLLTVMLHAQFGRDSDAGRGSNLARRMAEPPALAGVGWPLLTAVGSGTTMLDDVDETYRALRTRVPKVEFYDTPLENVFEFVREVSKVNIWVNWGGLEASGIDRQAVVSMELHDVTLGRFLELLCAQVGGMDATIAFGQKDNVIEINTSELLQSPRPDIDTEQRVYDVRRLLQTVIEGDDLGLLPDNVDDLRDALRDLITSTVSSEVWVDNGGSLGSIEFFAGLMVVRAPNMIHAEVEKLLDQLTQHLGGQAGGLSRAGEPLLPLAGPAPAKSSRPGAADDARPKSAQQDRPKRKPGAKRQDKKPDANEAQPSKVTAPAADSSPGPVDPAQPRQVPPDRPGPQPKPDPVGERP